MKSKNDAKILIVHGAKTPTQRWPFLNQAEKHIFKFLHADPTLTNLNQRWNWYLRNKGYESKLFEWSGLLPSHSAFYEDADTLTAEIQSYKPDVILAHSLGSELTSLAYDNLNTNPNMITLAPVMGKRSYSLTHIHSPYDYFARLGNMLYFNSQRPFSENDTVLEFPKIVHEHFIPHKKLGYQSTLGDIVSLELSKRL